MNKALKTLGCLLGAVAFAQAATAQEFPESNKPIKIVVPYTAGGSSDFLARTVAKKLAENMQHNVIVDNRPGGSTVIGGEYVARSNPDGYTVYLIGEMTNASLVALNKNLPYDPVNSFAGITNLVQSPLVISVHPDFPAKTLSEFVAYAKANPGVVTYGSAGLGNTLHLAGAKFAADTGIDMTHVPYKGASQAIVDLVAGRISVMFDLPQTPLPQIKEGKLRPLAVTGKERLDLLPDVPTPAEAGVPQYNFATRIGLAVPAKTPDAVKNRLHAEVTKAMSDPEVQKTLASRAMYVNTSAAPQDYDKDLRNAVDSVAKLLRDAGVQPQ
ncbi:MAG: Bug family tripartite tricarboxylate transporter substrate binding protein [Burkholderiaceae bacterium]|jgi:tripartite-type tricarboxylate transporter receptor subunit TctC